VTEPHGQGPEECEGQLWDVVEVTRDAPVTRYEK